MSPPPPYPLLSPAVTHYTSFWHVLRGWLNTTGTKIAYYYAWLKFYTLALVFPTVVGIIIWWREGTHANDGHDWCTRGKNCRSLCNAPRGRSKFTWKTPTSRSVGRGVDQKVPRCSSADIYMILLNMTILHIVALSRGRIPRRRRLRSITCPSGHTTSASPLRARVPIIKPTVECFFGTK